MGENPFRFFRGSCHLFYEGVPADSPVRATPLAWGCGDLHFENFGTFKGQNRLTYFDVNDFDEACLLPAGCDLARLITSVLLGAEAISLAEDEALALSEAFLESYRRALAGGKAGWVERATAAGMVQALLEGLKKRSRRQLLDQRTERRDSGRRLRIDGLHHAAATEAQRRKVLTCLRRVGVEQEAPEFYTVLDVACRIAGTGSLGLERYVVLIEGHGSPHENFLLDLKEAIPASPTLYLPVPQPVWPGQADRIVTVQQRFQAVSPAHLSAVVMRGKPFTLRELQPMQDRLDLSQWNGKLKRLARLLQTMGQVVAWGHLRGGGRQGSATADAWVDFGARTNWQKSILDFARSYQQQVRSDWQVFREALDDGAIT